MKFTLNWLKDYLDINADIDIKKLTSALTDIGPKRLLHLLWRELTRRSRIRMRIGLKSAKFLMAQIPSKSFVERPMRGLVFTWSWPQRVYASQLME